MRPIKATVAVTLTVAQLDTLREIIRHEYERNRAVLRGLYDDDDSMRKPEQIIAFEHGQESLGELAAVFDMNLRGEKG